MLAAEKIEKNCFYISGKFIGENILFKILMNFQVVFSEITYS